MAASRLSMLSRVTASVIVGYAFTIAVAAALATLLWRGQLVPRDDAVIVAALLGCAGYPIVVMWGFAASRVGRVWLVCAGGAAIAAAMAYALARTGH